MKQFVGVIPQTVVQASAPASVQDAAAPTAPAAVQASAPASVQDAVQASPPSAIQDAAARPALTTDELAILEFEQLWQRTATAARLADKAAQIRLQLGISPTRYYRRLYVLCHHPAAVAQFPTVLRNVRSVRDRRRMERPVLRAA